MADSILKQILTELATTLSGVTTGGGYTHTFTVQKRKRGGNAPQAGQVLAVVGLGSASPLPGVSQPDIGYEQNFGIEVYIDPDESAATGVDDENAQVRACAEKILMVDEYRGGLANETILKGGVPFTNGAYNGILVMIAVRYRTLYNDPYTHAG